MKNFLFTKRPPRSLVQFDFTRIVLQCSVFILIFFCHTSCSHPKEEVTFSLEERERYNELFLDLMLYETGIYTLYGDKPVTISLLEDSDETEDPLYIDRTKETKYTLIESWDLWIKKVEELQAQKFLFAKKEIPGMDGVYNAFFVNVPATISILKKHYGVFRDELGFDFDPETIVFQIREKDSEFWSKAFKIESHVTKGLLHGFELENSRKFADLRPDEMAGQLSNILLPYEQTSLQNFNLPFFRYFEKPDPILEMYKKERVKIQKFYQGKTLFEGTIELLQSND